MKTTFYHFRVKKNNVIQSNGGVTVACVTGDGFYSLDYARCSKSDNYSKKKGRLIAEGRALKKFHNNVLTPIGNEDSQKRSSLGFGHELMKKYFKGVFNG